jgi:hypothetical protein
VENAILGKDFNLGATNSLFHAFTQGSLKPSQSWGDLCFGRCQIVIEHDVSFFLFYFAPIVKKILTLNINLYLFTQQVWG